MDIDAIKSTPGTPSIDPGTPSIDPMSLDSHAQLESPKSPKSPKTPSKKPQTPEILSPLLLATEITPITSRDEDSAIYSDSDVGSQNSTRLKPPKKRSSSTSRRRKSDSSDTKSGRSGRSAGNTRVIPQTTKIFRNLLILEESLRQQSKDQRILRRKFTAFIAILAGLEGFTVYSLYFVVVPPNPVVKITLQLLMLFILVTLILYQLSGEYNRTIVIPRKFFNSTNKGLRQLNLRLVKVKSPISQQVVDFWRMILRSVVSFILVILNLLSFLQTIELVKSITQKLRGLEVTAQPRLGVTDVKLVLNPRGFNSEIRETWELYRDEFWVKEAAKRNKSEDAFISSNPTSASVLDKSILLERHRKERKDRRRSRLIDDPMSSSGELLKDRSPEPRTGRTRSS